MNEQRARYELYVGYDWQEVGDPDDAAYHCAKHEIPLDKAVIRRTITERKEAGVELFETTRESIRMLADVIGRDDWYPEDRQPVVVDAGLQPLGKPSW